MLSGAPVATHQGAITADETWQGIHEVTATVTVKQGTLTIAPCSEVRLAPNASIEVAPTGTALVAEGTADGPIRFVRSATQPWGHVSATAPARLSLANARLDGGGTAGDFKTADQLGATLVARGDSTVPAIVKIDHVAIAGSSGLGVFLNAARFEPGSAALTVSGSGFFPILLGADSVTDLPDGAYTGNANDEILLQTSGTSAAFEQGRAIVSAVVMHDRGVPYRVGAIATEIRIGASPPSPRGQLTIEAGVALKFAARSGSNISRVLVSGAGGVAWGALVVQGNAAKPVTFTSAATTPAAGDWIGIDLAELDPATQIDHAIIEDAGGPSSTTGVCLWAPGATDFRADAAVIASLTNPPASEFITNTTISASAGSGIHRGWRATDLDFLSSNTFVGVAGCLQTNVPNAQNSCPATPCPVE